MKLIILYLLTGLLIQAASAQALFDRPWLDVRTAIVIDPFQGNEIDWERLATDRRVAAIVHRATIGLRTDTAYEMRRQTAKAAGYKWGSYHLGCPGDGAAQADNYIKTAVPTPDELMALDLEGLDPAADMSLADAVLFIDRIRQRTGRYPVLYGNKNVVAEISRQYGRTNIFAKVPLWYARFKPTVDDFDTGTWDSYTLWQFSSEINCPPAARAQCLYSVPRTSSDMDINVYNGTVEELRSRWPL